MPRISRWLSDSNFFVCLALVKDVMMFVLMAPCGCAGCMALANVIGPPLSLLLHHLPPFANRQSWLLRCCWRVQGDLQAAIENYHKSLGMRPDDSFAAEMLTCAMDDEVMRDEAGAAY